MPAKIAMQLELFGVDTAPEPTPATPAPRQPDPAAPANRKRRIHLGEYGIDYALRRSKRHSIGFLIDNDGLRVTAPRWVTLSDIEKAIQSKQNWIISKLDGHKKASAHRQNEAIEWRDGATLPYLGQPITLRLSLASAAEIAYHDAHSELKISLPSDATEAQLRTLALKWLQQQAIDLFGQRMRHYAEQLGVSYRSFGLSAATTRWGSCSARGTIRLNWRLIHLPPVLIDYVIAHELSHLREMNHSARFWGTVESVYPDYRAARQALRQHGVRLSFDF